MAGSGTVATITRLHTRHADDVKKDDANVFVLERHFTMGNTAYKKEDAAAYLQATHCYVTCQSHTMSLCVQQQRSEVLARGHRVVSL